MTDGAPRRDFVVRGDPGRALRGGVPVPSDKSIAHRGLILGALGRGTTELRRFSYGGDNVSTLGIVRALGVEVDDDGAGTLRVHGKGLLGLTAPADDLDCGNSGTSMRVLAGVLAAQPFSSRLVGDASLSKRPMARVADPLRRRGARIEGVFHPSKAGEITPPLSITGLADGHRLGASEEVLAVASAQVKTALLLSGLFADGSTMVREPLVSRDHTERMLAALGLPIEAIGPLVRFDVARFDGELPAFSMDIPGDLSAGAFLWVAAALSPGGAVTVRDVGLNPTRAGVLDVLRLVGAHVEVEPRTDALGEPIGHVTVRGGPLLGAAVGGELVVRSIDEIPIVTCLAAGMHGTLRVTDARELRVKESDRLAAMAEVLRAFGLACEELPDGLVVEGARGRPLHTADVESRGDHRIAMSAAVLGCFAEGETRVRDVDCVATSFPRFAGTLRALGADVRAV